MERKQVKRQLQKQNHNQEKRQQLENSAREGQTQRDLETRRIQDRQAAIEKESEDRRRKEIRKSPSSIAANPPDEFKSEMRGSAGGEGEVDQPQNQSTRKPKTQGEILSNIKKKTKTEISIKKPATALPRLIIECLAKWVVCHDAQTDNKDKLSNVVWDTSGLLGAYQDVWKTRKLCAGPPRAAADVGGELDVSAMIVEEPLLLDKTATEKMKLQRPFAILVPTTHLKIFRNMRGDIIKDDFQYIHILRPFETGMHRFCFVSWLCWGLKIPGGEVFAESPSIFLTEIEGERGFFVGQTGASRPMSTHRMVRALAGEIVEMKVKRSKFRKKAAKIKKIELLRFLATAPKTNIEQQPDISFEQLLDKCFVGQESEKRAYLKTASKHIKTTKEIGRKLLVEAALILLGADDKLMQREAAVVLSSHDVGRDIAEWDRILVKAMMMYSFLKEEESPSPLFKSLRYLISKAILANPEGAAAAAVVFCETDNGRNEIPEHMVKQLETWAAKYTQEGRALKWHQILKALGLPERPKIEQQDRDTAASIDFRGRQRKGDPTSIMEFNLNGMQARWKQKEDRLAGPADKQEIDNLVTAMKKSNSRRVPKVRMGEKGSKNQRTTKGRYFFWTYLRIFFFHPMPT